MSGVHNVGPLCAIFALSAANGSTGIKQGPWTQINQEQLQRAFEYQIDYVSMFGGSVGLIYLPGC